jgi:hypothetical protein
LSRTLFSLNPTSIYASGGIIYLARNPDTPEPKKLLFTAEHAENAEMFFVFIIKFFLRDFCALCGDKNR